MLKKAAARKYCRDLPYFLFLAEGHAVSALIHSGISFMGAHQDALQRAVICFVTMMCALMNGAFDALVSIAIHGSFLLLSVMFLL